jgi:hypothetical protein
MSKRTLEKVRICALFWSHAGTYSLYKAISVFSLCNMVTWAIFPKKILYVGFAMPFFCHQMAKKHPKKRKKICWGEVIFRIGPLKHKARFGHKKQ